MTDTKVERVQRLAHRSDVAAVFNGDLAAGQVDPDAIDAVELIQTHPNKLLLGGAVHALDAEPADRHRGTCSGMRPRRGMKRPTWVA